MTNDVMIYGYSSNVEDLLIASQEIFHTIVWFFEDRILIKKITRPVEVKHVIVTISRKDEDGDYLEKKARKIHTLRKIIEDFPRVLKALKKE